jgi:hypothetical protein
LNRQGYEANVHDFIKDQVEADPWRRRENPYPANGWAKPWPEALVQRNRNDISDKNIDEEVHGFVAADKNVPAINEQDKRQTAYPANGWDAKPWAAALAQPVPKSKKRDVGEKGMDEEVHGFVIDDKNVPPINAMARSDRPYPPNGYDAKPWPTPDGLSLHQKRDVPLNRDGFEANVHDFIKDKVESVPWTRRENPFPVNGWAKPWPEALS